MEFEEDYETNIGVNEESLSNVKINDADRVTIPIITKYERAHVLGVRAEQLSSGAPPFVDIEYESDFLKIARKELLEGKIPFIIRRKFSDGSYEDWPISDLDIGTWI